MFAHVAGLAGRRGHRATSSAGAVRGTTTGTSTLSCGGSLVRQPASEGANDRQRHGIWTALRHRLDRDGSH